MKNNDNIITVLSLFDGISCARVALDRLGYRDIRYLASEVDKYAIQIAQKNYPDTIQLGDVCKIQRDMLPQHIDLLIGGSPCQDLSIAKKNRKGLDGERSGLFWEWVRLWKECQPRYWVLENVNSMPKEAKRIISETLGVEPIMINAALVSAQSRKRLFWTNIATDVFGNCHIPQPEDRGILLKDVLESGVTINNENKSLCIGANYKKVGGSQDCLQRRYDKRWTQLVTEPVRTMDNASQSGWVEEKDEKGERYDVYITQRGRGFNKGGDRARDGKAPTLSANSWEDNNHIVIRDPKMAIPIRIGDMGSNPQCETAVAGQSIMQNYTIRKLTPVECERLMTLPDKYTEGISNTQRYKCLGNGFVVDVVKHILSYMDGLE